jgi:hypothetical protein
MATLKELGGAQFILTFTVLVIVAFRSILGLDADTITILTSIALGGSTALGAKNVIQARAAAKTEEETIRMPDDPMK